LSIKQSGKPLPASEIPVWNEYRFRSELTAKLTIVVKAYSEDSAKEELARIGLHPAFFELFERSDG